MQLLVSSSSPVQVHVGACLVLAVGACPLLHSGQRVRQQWRGEDGFKFCHVSLAQGLDLASYPDEHEIVEAIAVGVLALDCSQLTSGVGAALCTSQRQQHKRQQERMPQRHGSSAPVDTALYGITVAKKEGRASHRCGPAKWSHTL